MMLYERLAEDTLQSEYYYRLYEKASRLLAANIFDLPADELKLTDKEFNDLLRFADILSNSKIPQARNQAYQVITLLNVVYRGNEYYKIFAHSVLAKLGNFPGIAYLNDVDQNLSQLPFDRDIEKKKKEIIQAVPDTENLVFTDAQFELYEKISTSKNFSFSGPTSMGKSFIIKSFIRKAITNSPPENIVILVPTRALINQFSIDLNRELKEQLSAAGYRVATNSNIGETANIKSQLYVLILTPERLLSYLSQTNNPPIGYLFVDEAHKIAAEKDARSVTSYNAIAKALRLYPSLNLYFASPNVANPEVFLKLFNREVKNSYRTSESPVSQNLFFIDFPEQKVSHYLNQSVYEITDAIPDWNTEKIIHSIGDGSSNIVYCSSKAQSVIRARALQTRFTSAGVAPVSSQAIRQATRQIKTYIHKDYYLAEFLEFGIAYHFGNLPQIIRNKVETLFKESEIQYVFCTSTLLEGVNLPAKNVFILNDKNGSQPLERIDFWNLAGRAGRLRYELSGNIFCIRETAGDWKRPELLNKNVDITINPTVENLIDTKLKQIEALLKKEEVKRETVTMKEILTYIANVINIDSLEIERSNYRSAIITKLINENKDDIIAIAKKNVEGMQIPSDVLNANQSISLEVLNEVYAELKKRKEQGIDVRLPAQIKHSICLEWLLEFYRLFKWEKHEKDLKNSRSLSYYATIMNQWINDFALSQIINGCIDYYVQNNRQIKTGFKPTDLEMFSKNNKEHVNILISNVIEDIEYVLRFLFEKYFNAYYVMLVNLYGEENAGSNWATFLEYGTKSTIVISLQNYGLSRHSAMYLFRTHRDCLVIEGNNLLEINFDRLRVMLDREAIEYDEIRSVLL